MLNNWFKKEKPFLSGTSTSGGAGGFVVDSSGFVESTFTGGTVTQINVSGQNYNLHTFLANPNVGGAPDTATLTVTGPNNGAGGTDGQIEIFLVGGGGGGGVLGGGGGGGGVAVYRMPTGIRPGTYTIGIGQGGVGDQGWSYTTSNGSPSYFQYDGANDKIEVAGGGAGQSYSFSHPQNTTLNVNVANTGGENYPGNSTDSHWSYQPATSTISTPKGQFDRILDASNNAGGQATSNCCPCRGGGGAGAGSGGINARPGPQNYSGGANGGNGYQYNFDGNNYYWGGGGAGDGYCQAGPPFSSNYQGNGGLGGGGGSGGIGSNGGFGGGSAINPGGNGPPSSGDSPGAPGGAHSGGGGGAGSNGSGSTPYTGGNGGPGIVMIRYKV